MTFHDDEHRINNTGWIRNGDETEEWNKKQNHRGDAERFSIYIFSIRNEAMSRIYACKNWEDSANIWLNSNSHVCGLHCLTFVYENKAGKSTQWGESPFKKELSVISHKIWRSLLANWILLHCRQKPQPLCEMGMKRKLEKQGKCGHRLIVYSVSPRADLKIINS